MLSGLQQSLCDKREPHPALALGPITEPHHAYADFPILVLQKAQYCDFG